MVSAFLPKVALRNPMKLRVHHLNQLSARGGVPIPELMEKGGDLGIGRRYGASIQLPRRPSLLRIAAKILQPSLNQAGGDAQ